jgi:hypothetical protein
MFNFFKCSHPANSLIVEKDATIKNIDEDFDAVDYHFICTKCGENVTVGYAKMIGGVDAFIERGRKRYEDV